MILVCWFAADVSSFKLPSTSHFQVIGVGSGSTVPYVVERIVQQGEAANKGRVFIPTGSSACLSLGRYSRSPSDAHVLACSAS